MPKIYSNVCPRDCCNCNIKTVADEGRIIGITGDKDDPYTLGAICPKGYAYLSMQYSKKRLKYPMKQKSKGSGEWERISWDHALSEIANKLIGIKEQEGNLLSVCLAKNFGNVGLLNNSVEGFFRSIGYVTFMAGSLSLCNAAGIDALLLSYGACKKPHPADMANSKLIIIWGGNPAWTYVPQMRYVSQAKANGGKVVVIDPYLSETAARGILDDKGCYKHR
ncbi:MAG: molybdopterin-dependent oxidoreductase, partial [Desulfitobacterium sp.]|nr:molybdopterin-dependent oxidoreductase [Desulfitobacterium sp.]